MYQGSGEDLALVFLLLYEALYKSLKCHEVSFWKNKISFADGGISKKHFFFENLNHLLINVEYIWISILQVLHNKYLHILGHIYTVLYMK